MAIAQMNWGRMRYSLDDPRMAEFSGALDQVYDLAEAHPGFIWRVPDDAAAEQLKALGHDDLISATVSVWSDVNALRSYTFETLHGEFLTRAREWFAEVEGPQLVIWDVDDTARPSFAEAFDRLAYLAKTGSTPMAYGWP